ncbi:DUF885 domain-containing protein [Jiangella endophytica]|uniref:DUF885 domain-containing protein n=1 Tax=Jiangella endophytica TaxID=1623398 RepID=UPI000E340747|nr:DUF885 domain-containing protein [Jiangella endophytica]
MPHDDADTPRKIADRYVETIADLDPTVGTALGIRPGVDTMPDLSPEGQQAEAGAARATLAELDAAERAAAADGGLPAQERRAARLLRERLTAALAVHDAGEGLRDLSNILTPVQSLRSIFQIMPTATDDDWAVIGRRLRNVPGAARGYRAALEEGDRQGKYAAPRQVDAVVEQLGTWLSTDWYTTFAGGGPEPQRGELTAAAAQATAGLAELRDYLATTYRPAAEGTPDGVGRERYAALARRWTGADLDLEDAYAYGWSEFHRIGDEMKQAADAVLPGHTPLAVMRHLDEHGEAIEGVDAVRDWLQNLMNDAMADLDGTHVDLAEPIKHVEAMIAPPGSAAAPYYTRPSLDFSRPGRTWLPTLGETRFPVWGLVSTWYHEGVPGHHLQLAQWVHVADQLSRYQVSLGSVSATTEGWALYAERLMDELGYLTDPARRLGYLDAQIMRAIRVIVDIGMHLRLRIPNGETFHPGEVWTPELAREFFGAFNGRDAAFLDSEIIRYLGVPGQAISYKLGERAWLSGRDAARASQGADFDLKAWHMAALSMGSLGLDDLADELARLP